LRDLKASLSNEAPAPDLGAPLTALWWAAKGDWNRAHGLVDHEVTEEAAWVHAYLHRVEGDIANAGYWYRKAGKPVENGPLQAEWEQIASTLPGP
jgi:hypothetical protein